jgi:hypothetical protein
MPKSNTNLIAAIVTTLMVSNAIAEAKHEDHAHSFAKDVDAFHAALAPLWHARPGQERSQNVCAQAGTLVALATDIHSADPKPLLASLAALKAQCKTSPTKIDAVFTEVHEAFHHLIEPARRPR